MKILFALVLATSCIRAACSAEEPLVWPRFRGPDGSGIAEGQKPPVEIGPDKNVKWKVSVPPGISSPIVAGENLIVTAFDGGKLFTIAYRRADGQEAWRTEAPAQAIEPFHKVEGSPAASTSATDGKHIVSYVGSCGLFCYDLNGKELWHYEMPAAATAGGFGSGASPIIADNLAVLVRDDIKESKIVALDIASGKLKWERKRNSMASWCTPVIWDTPSGTQIAAAGHVRMIGYDLGSGDEKWSVTGMPSGCCASPVIADGKLFFAGTSSSGADEKPMAMPTFDSMLTNLDKDKDGAISRDEGEKALHGFFDNQDTNKDGRITRDEYEMIMKFMSEGKNSAFAMKAGGSGDVTDSNILWKKTKGLPYIASVILYGGQCVLIKDGGIVIACDPKTGDQVYRERTGETGYYYASPVAANGHIYVTSLASGVVTVLQAGAKKAKVIAKNPELGERVAATPAIADDCLYIRTAERLYAFAEKK
ncbi:MAG TPA: PQQ-binding-like beta-propeller repeat protein [Pirellulales bacterium]|nr:PQQ-binding-like beta-propeller repeat protein [Pirellulales bacterium]